MDKYDFYQKPEKSEDGSGVNELFSLFWYERGDGDMQCQLSEKDFPGGYYSCSSKEGFPFLSISDRFLDILGWTREEIREKFDNKLANMVHPDDQDLMVVYTEQRVSPVRKDNFLDQMYRMQGKDGYHWISNSTLIVEREGEKIFQGSIADVTKFMNKIEKEEASLRKADEMKSRFLSAVSHDIRTPINGIQGMLRIADAYPEDMKKQNECREKMWMASNHLVSLVNNVLDMKRLESSEIELKEEPFNLIDLLMSITSMTDMQIEAKGLHSVVDWKPGYIKHRYLIGCAEGFSRVLLNLNNNAIKYNKKGGSIYCRCMEKECDGDTVWFETITADTGIGMDEEFLKRAFEPYAQKNNSSISSENGVGLGLSIVKKTVDMMGGTLKVESKVGEGTTYTIMFPFKIDPNPHQEKKSLEHVKLDEVKALLVEDNDLNLEIAKFYLEQQKVQVFTARNGQEAVEMFEKSEIGFYDIILMDIMMPVMDGLEATRQIRGLNRPDALAIPIVAMSANAFQEDVQKSLEAGMNAHLVKPLDGEKVIDTIKKYLANKLLEEKY